MFQLMCMVVSVVYAASTPHCTESPPTILIYTSGDAPILAELAEGGVEASINPYFPEKFTPKHQSIATGMFAESHGIIDDIFFDSEFNTTFDVCDQIESSRPRYYRHEPIWNTFMRQADGHTAIFWPGAEIEFGGQLPTYTMSPSSSSYEIIQEIVRLLTLPAIEQRPRFVLMSMNDPCLTRTIKPNSPQETERQQYLDHLLEHLIEELKIANLLPCANFIILSENEMQQPSEFISDPIINLKDYIPEIEQFAEIKTGDFPRINPISNTLEAARRLMSKLVCRRDELRAYHKSDLPTRFHFTNNHRIEDIVLDIDPGYTVTLSHSTNRSRFKKNKQTKFIATGPAFKKSIKIEPFDNIELYNLLATLTEVEPLPNDGTQGSLYHILENSPPYPEIPLANPPPTSQYPEGDLKPLLQMSGCPHDLQFPEEWLESLNLNSKEQEDLENIHMPFGIPQSSLHPAASLTLLHNPDQVTGYSEALKQPLFSSFTVENGRPGTPENEEWFSDVRLTPETTQTCASYDELPSSFDMRPLFPPQFSSRTELAHLPYLISNALPISDSLHRRWRYLLLNLVPTLVKNKEPFNLLVGPAFDSFPDNFQAFATSEIPSDLFAVITFCKFEVTQLMECPSEELDTVSFIFPQEHLEDNCMRPEQYAFQYRATPRDVERITGLRLFPKIEASNRIKLLLTTHRELFMQS